MKREILKTDDGSHTILCNEFNSTFHSTHGAIQESKHVFIKHGLKYYQKEFKKNNIRILEYGFGTGLNALLALDFSMRNNVEIDYLAIEAFPISIDDANLLNYNDDLKLNNLKESFLSMHIDSDIGNMVIDDNFIFSKEKILFEEFEANVKFDIVFFDAFSPDVQPYLWERPFLDSVYNLLKNNGVLITYGAKGSFKRALKSIGFYIENPPGPPGKREITRGVKSI